MFHVKCIIKQVLACTVAFQLQFKIGIIPTILVVFVVFNVLENFTKLTNGHNIISDSSGKIKAIIIILTTNTNTK